MPFFVMNVIVPALSVWPLNDTLPLSEALPPPHPDAVRVRTKIPAAATRLRTQLGKVTETLRRMMRNSGPDGPVRQDDWLRPDKHQGIKPVSIDSFWPRVDSAGMIGRAEYGINFTAPSAMMNMAPPG